MSNYHAWDAKEVLADFKSSVKGLKSTEAAKRLEKYGSNEIPREKRANWLTIFFSQFHNALVYVLLVAGVLSVALKEFVDASVIFGAVLVNVIIGFIQESKAGNAIDRLKSLVEHKAFVLRDGKEMSLDSKDVTIGDVIFLEAGNRIPADGRLLESSGLQVNEAGLTGESVPSSKKTPPIPKGAALADRENMVYAGTMVVHGSGKAVVTAIGQNTEIGQIAEMVKSADKEQTPLQTRLSQFSRILGFMFAAICAVIAISGFLQGRSALEMVKVGAAVGVASIPEGLVVAVTFILALGMQQILRQKALVRKLVAAETLGSISVICTDKTGTLTEGKMHVVHIIIGDKEFEFTSLAGRQAGDEARVASLALQAGMMCNNAVVENPDEELGEWRIIGSSTEAAILSAGVQSGLRQEKLSEVEPRLAELPFESERKFMITLHKRRQSKDYVVYEKGAPERLLDKSAKFYHQGKQVALDGKARTKLDKTYEKLTERGLRVIGVALRELGSEDVSEPVVPDKINWDVLDQDLTFVGFLALKDPLRPQAKETIKLCRQAGIRPVVITGDHKLTAQAIAREVGLNVRTENVMVGSELDEIADNELGKMVKKVDVYARVSPHHKLRIVKALKSRGEVVAMTGDGINDAPALKAADIGVSLGNGTDIAKETSDIVLLDNNFRTIVSAVWQGRIIFKNIRKVITYLISDSFSEMILIMGSIILGMPLAVLPTQILWINIVNDGLPHFSLAFEKGDGTEMKEKPIQKDIPLLNQEMKYIIFVAGLIRDVIIFWLFYYLFTSQTMELGHIRTLMFAILGVKSLMSVFSIRSFNIPVWRMNPLSNKYLLAAVAASFTLLFLGVEWGPLQTVLRTEGLHASQWLFAFLVGFLSVALIEAVKFRFHITPSKFSLSDLEDSNEIAGPGIQAIKPT
jgi:Ca2+-transporting ATPase